MSCLLIAGLTAYLVWHESLDSSNAYMFIAVFGGLTIKAREVRVALEARRAVARQYQNGDVVTGVPTVRLTDQIQGPWNLSTWAPAAFLALGLTLAATGVGLARQGDRSDVSVALMLCGWILIGGRLRDMRAGSIRPNALGRPTT